MDHRSIPSSPSLKARPFLVALLASATTVFAWTASGTVKSTTGTALAGVAVTVKDSASYGTTTSANGAFSLGSPTGIRWESSAASKWGVRMVGGEMEIAAPADGPLRLSLVDMQGRTLWALSAVAQQGKARFAAPTGLGYGAAVLRLRQGVDEYDAAVTTGPEGTRIAKHIVAPRAMAGNPVLQFKKTGYRDTTYTMTSETATGLSIVMGEIATTTCPTPKLAAGSQNKTITVKGVQRKYILHVPAGYTGNAPVPLLVDFHPIGGSAQGQFGGTQYKSQADKDGAISVYPDGMTGPMGQAWNVKGCCTTADDTAFARALVAEVKKVACIDPKRIYAAGFSMGGGMTHFSACHLSDIFAAVAPAAFDLLKENVDICKPVRPLTVVMFRGTNDNVVKYDGGYSAVVSGMPINFLGAKATFEKWAALNTCTGSPSAQDGNGCSTYSNCAGGVQVTLCTKQGGGHDQGNGSIGWPLLKKYTLP
jgi:poly(3-hydroxybutyrate) depolymerase